MNIELAKSTYALMLADPLGILAENEIHLGFSSAFKDPEDKWEEMMLHGLDVLVARLPASLPSDIQKVSPGLLLFGQNQSLHKHTDFTL